MYIIDNKTLNLPHKSANYWRYECGQMPKNANVICEGSLKRGLKSSMQKDDFFIEKL